MQLEKLKLILEQVQSGQKNVDSAMAELRHFPYEDLDGYATLDHHRALRNSFPEVVLGQGKQPDQVASIACHLAEHSCRMRSILTASIR